MPETGSRSSGRLLFELLDETLDINYTENLHLSIQVRLDGLLFAILDHAGSKYLAIKQYGFDRASDDLVQYRELEHILDSDPFLRKDYMSVSCIFTGNRSTLLPSGLFEQEQSKLYFEFNHVLKELDELHYSFMKQFEAYLVFPIHTEVAGLLLRRWTNISFHHQAEPFLNSMISLNDPLIAGINFNDDHFDFAVVKERKLLYHNNFSYRSEEDLVYFLLFAFNKSGLDPESTQLLISGDLDKYSGKPQKLRNYIRKVSFQTAPADFRYPSSFQKVQDHALLNLLLLYHCG